MKRMALLAAGLLASGAAMAATAYFTGRQEQVTTVTGQIAWRCEYDFNGQKLYYVFQGTCPHSVDVL